MNSPTIEDRLERLARDDKWYLSAGDGILWAPAFPVWLDAPGFWDEAHVYYHPFAPLFGVALVDADGNEIPLRQVSRKWRPDRLVSRYVTPEGAELVETREALGRGRFGSRWTVGNAVALESSRGRLSLVAYSAQPGDQVSGAERVSLGGVCWRRVLTDRRDQKMEIDATLTVTGAEPSAVRVAAVRSEGSAVQPRWRFTPFGERWNRHRDGHAELGLRQETRLEGLNTLGLVYVAVAAPFSGAPGDTVGFEIELLPVDAAFRLPLSRAVGTPTPGWSEFMAALPVFGCSDEYIERYYDYRAYGLRLCRLEGGAGNVRHPAIAEGISYFHVPITYSGQCHMFEMRWSSHPDVARGTLLNFLDHQKPDGSFHGRIYTNHLIDTDFYLASWGDAALAVDAIHPNDEFAARIYPGLCRYAEWMDATRDPDGTGMYDVINHFETGQEYMSRYQSVNPKADLDGWKDSTRLKAIDATVYAYLLHRALATLAPRVGDCRGGDWSVRADRVGRAIVERMWDERAGMFSDVDPRSGARTGVEAAVCFYPMLTDLLTESHLSRLLTRLEDPEAFGTPFPIPSSSVGDPLFNADAEWKGKRHVCPWNGRVWPMTNSHAIDGLIRQWRLRDPRGSSDSARARAGVLAGTLLPKFIRMMYHGGDLKRPNCFEHYNPLTGHACEYRGIDDYQHSWVNDLIIRGVMGVDPGNHGRAPSLVVDPLPLPDVDASIAGVRIGGHELRVRRERGRAGGPGKFEAAFRGQTRQSSIGVPVLFAR